MCPKPQPGGRDHVRRTAASDCHRLLRHLNDGMAENGKDNGSSDGIPYERFGSSQNRKDRLQGMA
jgi:hypothetical protein